MNSFVLLAHASLTASRTLLQRLLACLNFTLESEDLSFWYKQKKWFLWTMAAAQEAENHEDAVTVKSKLNLLLFKREILFSETTVTTYGYPSTAY